MSCPRRNEGVPPLAYFPKFGNELYPPAIQPRFGAGSKITALPPLKRCRNDGYMRTGHLVLNILITLCSVAAPGISSHVSPGVNVCDFGYFNEVAGPAGGHGKSFC